jgi:hypothetical protein
VFSSAQAPHLHKSDQEVKGGNDHFNSEKARRRIDFIAATTHNNANIREHYIEAVKVIRH